MMVFGRQSCIPYALQLRGHGPREEGKVVLQLRVRKVP